MPDSTQQVIIEFVSDTSQLQPAVDELVALGTIDAKSAQIFKQTNEQLSQRNDLLDTAVSASNDLNASAGKQQAVYDKLTSSVKALSNSTQSATQNMLKLSTGDLAKTFSSGSASVDGYVASVQDAEAASDNLGKTSVTLRTQLRSVTNELAALQAAGETDGAEFNTLATEAGRLRNALTNVQGTIANLGSDVPVLKVFEGGVRGITGAFTAATGASAAFGENNKDLEEVLVKVNGVMAINAGLSEVLNVLRDEEFITTAKVIAANVANNIQLQINNALQSESVIVRGAATVAQLALNAAMALSPLGIITIALGAFIAGILLYTNYATGAAKAQADLNNAIFLAGSHFDAEVQGSANATKKIVADLEARNAKQSEITRVEGQTLLDADKQRVEQIDNLNKTIEAHRDSTNKDTQEVVKKANEKLEDLETQHQAAIADIIVKHAEFEKQLREEALNDTINDNAARLALAQKDSNEQFAAQRALAVAKSKLDIDAAGDDAAKVKAIQAQLAQDILNINVAAAQAQQVRIAAGLEAAAINAATASKAINDRLSADEVAAQIRVIQQQADADIKIEAMTRNSENVKADIRAKANAQTQALQLQFNTESANDAITDQIALSKKTLDLVNIGAKQKLDIQIQNVIDEAAIEINNNRGKNAIILGIEADRDAKIKALRLASIEDEAAKEAALTEAQNAGTIRALEKTLTDQATIRNENDFFGAKQVAARLGVQKLDLASQKAIVDQITQFTLDADQKKLDSLDIELAQGLISVQDYNISYAKLIDDQAKAVEAGEKRKTDLTAATIAKQKQANKALLDGVLNDAGQAADILKSLYDQQDQAQEDSINRQRDNITALQNAGEITTKAAMAQNQALDAQERALQRKAAQRDKEIALFEAVINTAKAVTAALAVPIVGPILAGIAAALGAAQIAVIASKPLPQFGKGKLGNYEGYAEVGETGPEFVSRNGRMYLEEKPTVTWLGASDKVFNPAQTAAMLENRAGSNYLPSSIAAASGGASFDYDKMGKAVGENVGKSGVGFDGQTLYRWTESKGNFTKYLNDRRKWR